jgi:hypothetical protein
MNLGMAHNLTMLAAICSSLTYKGGVYQVTEARSRPIDNATCKMTLILRRRGTLKEMVIEAPHRLSDAILRYARALRTMFCLSH